MELWGTGKANQRNKSNTPGLQYSGNRQTLSYNINPAIKQANPVIPDLIPADHGICDRHPVPAWIPAFAGMTTLRYLVAGAIM